MSQFKLEKIKVEVFDSKLHFQKLVSALASEQPGEGFLRKE